MAWRLKVTVQWNECSKMLQSNSSSHLIEEESLLQVIPDLGVDPALEIPILLIYTIRNGKLNTYLLFN